MKKFFAFALVASMMSLAACSEKKAAESTATVDSTMTAVADSATAIVDSAATMATDTTKK